MRLNATRRWGSLIGLRVQHVRSSMDVRPGGRDGVGTGDTKKTKGSPLDNEAHPKRRTSGGRVALLWKQLGVTSHILTVRENGSKHLITHLLGGERTPMFAPSTSAPVISISKNKLLKRRLPFFDLHAAQSTDAGWGRLWFCRFQVVGRLVLWDVVGGHNVCERGRPQLL